jgi:hypothetical protein
MRVETTLKIVRGSLRASYNEDPGDCLVLGLRSDGAEAFIYCAESMDEARRLAADPDALVEAYEAEAADLPKWSPRLIFVDAVESGYVARLWCEKEIREFPTVEAVREWARVVLRDWMQDGDKLTEFASTAGFGEVSVNDTDAAVFYCPKGEA